MTARHGPQSLPFANASLVGQPEGRHRLLTPALLVDRPRMNANIVKMQTIASNAKVALRPHGKAHKCPEIAHRQLAAGAAGICSATPGEAEAFAGNGIDNILVTSTFGTPAAAARLAGIAADITRLTVVVDAPAAAGLIADALKQRGARAHCLIDVDMGRHRSGVSDVSQARMLADAIQERDELELVGLQAYAGHLSHCRDIDERRAGTEAAGATIMSMLTALRDDLPAKPVVTGGSTGAVLQEIALGVYTELQCGSYVLMDAEYDMVDADGSGIPMFSTSLFVATAVISANHPGIATTDGGEKRFVAKHGTAPLLCRGAPEGSTYRATSDEHGTITLPRNKSLPLGTIVEVQVPHCDPTVNLYDAIHLVEGECIVDIWPVSARGA